MPIQWPFATLTLVVLLSFTSSQKTLASVLFVEGKTQGTLYHLSYTGPEYLGLKSQIEEQLLQFDKVFSNYRVDSEISLFNQSSSSDWIPVQQKLVNLIEVAHKISVQSDGAFDVTIGALLKIWGFGPFKRAVLTVPTDADIALAKKNVDYRLLLSRKQPPALKKLNPQIYVDLSGIAQGLSVDFVANFLDSKGINNYLIEIGGEIKTKGQKSPGEEWTLAIESPSMEPSALAIKVRARGKGFTTAGDYRDFFEQGGKRYSHTIDPRSGKPVQHSLASITVIAHSAVEADGWDTAFMVLGPEATRKTAAKKHLAAFIIMHQGQEFKTEAIGGFEKYLLAPK